MLLLPHQPNQGCGLLLLADQLLLASHKLLLAVCLYSAHVVCVEHQVFQETWLLRLLNAFSHHGYTWHMDRVIGRLQHFQTIALGPLTLP